MGLETVVNIADLVKTNPTGADPKSQGDDHIRNLKTALLNDFAGFAGAVMVTGVDGGAADAYTLTPANALPAYGTKMVAVFAPTVANTGASTLNISGLGVKNLLSVSGAPLVNGDLTVGGIYSAFYDGAQFRLTSMTKNYADQLVVSAAIPAQLLGFYRSDGVASTFTQTHTGYAQKEVKGADIASAATINLTTATGNFVHITGSAGPVTAITIPIGAEYTLIIDSTPTFVHSAALLLPGLANITAEAGDRMIVRGEAAGANVVSYIKSDGAAVKSGMVLLATLTPTIAANVDFLTAFSAKYDNYLIVGEGLTASANDVLRMRFANAGVIDTGVNYLMNTVTSSTLSLANNLQIGLSVAAGGAGGSFTMNITNINDTAGRMKSLGGQGASQDGASTYGLVLFVGGYKNAAAVSGFRLYWSAGANFGATGLVRVYGYHNT